MKIHNTKLDHPIAILNSIKQRTNLGPTVHLSKDGVDVLADGAEWVHDLV